MINKRGLSTIVATVLIVLLALAAVVIVWTVVQNMITQSGTSVSLGQKCLLSSAEVTSCAAGGGTAVTVTARLTKGDSADVSKLIAIAENSEGLTKTAEITSPVLLETQTSPAINVGGTTPWKGSVAVVVTDGTNTQTCDASEAVVCT